MNNITVISHRVGPGVIRPDRIRRITLNAGQKHHWAASLAADNKTAEGLLRTTTGIHIDTQMKPTSPLTENSRFSFPGARGQDLTSPMYPQDGAVSNGTMSSTKPVTVQFLVGDNQYPHFDMHYQTTDAQLRIYLEVNNASLSKEEDTEEYDWTPIMRESNYRSGAVLWASIPVFIHPSQDDSTKSVTTENIHYLSPEARTPVFVNPGTVQDLLQKSMDERDALLPKAQPSFVTREGDDVVRDRYFVWGQRQQSGMYYVGDTWLRKVVLPRKDEAEGPAGRLRIQS